MKMKKLVINSAYGGFGLSDAAIERYAELKGLTLHKEEDTFGSKFYFVPPEEFHKIHEEDKKNGSYKKTNELYFSDDDIERDDPILIQVVEELGEESWGRFAELKVVEIPDGIGFEISDYDGVEKIHEIHRSWS
jgi:hypothetical protein